MAAAALVTAVAPVLLALPHDRLAFDASLPILGWLPIGVAGVVVLDRRPRSALGRMSVAVAATPLVALLIAAVRVEGEVTALGVSRTVGDLGPLGLLPLLALAAVAGDRRGADRVDRRWGFWVVAASTVTMTCATAAWVLGSETAFGVIATAGLGLVAGVVATSALGAAPRPVDEPLLDIALVASVVALAVAGGGALRLVAQHERVFGADVVGALAAATTTALAAPAALWVRRELLVRRYGPGVLSPDDVAAITADLRSRPDPRQLLAKAAAMVTASSGIRTTRILLDEVDAPDGWSAHPLVVGSKRVGTLLAQPSHPEGLEARQERVVEQLLPTIALVARAVTLAVDADHARLDVAHERDAERARIMADLHDDLGPVLAGMSMRVAATRARHPIPELDALADDLASCRSDLRRIVAGFAPTALRTGDVGKAITDLVASFGAATRPGVELVGTVPDGVDARAGVVLYRTVAEGVTNAIRHAQADHVTVAIERTGGLLRLTVTDDGAGGVVVPGVGLSSLQARAEELGGTIELTAAVPTGTELALTLPEPS